MRPATELFYEGDSRIHNMSSAATKAAIAAELKTWEHLLEAISHVVSPGSGQRRHTRHRAVHGLNSHLRSPHAHA